MDEVYKIMNLHIHRSTWILLRRSPYNSVQRKHKVKVIKLDEFLDIKKCDFLKIDAENMDLEVLRGGKKFLQKFRPILWVENLKQYPNKVNKFLIENKYKPFWATTMLYNPDNYFINDNNYFLKEHPLVGA